MVIGGSKMEEEFEYFENLETEYDEWGNEIEWIDGFRYVDIDNVTSAEKEFEEELKYLSELPPSEKARLRKQWKME
jgi:hypothetical protein